MDLATFIIAVFCRIDEAVPRVLNGQRLRQRGPCPRLTDSEVLTMEVVGEYLGQEQDSALFAYFRRHYAHFFPALRTLHRTTFVRQAANLWWLKERLWQQVLGWKSGATAGNREECSQCQIEFRPNRSGEIERDLSGQADILLRQSSF